MSAIVVAESVYKTHRRGHIEVPAVAGVSLSIRAGEIVALVGPSGSGKSTLLNLLGALVRPDAGEIVLAGTALSTLDDAARTELRRDKVGLVFQSFHLLPLLTARENVALPLYLSGTPLAASESRADEMLERVGLVHRAHHRPRELSGGEMQRVAIARALAPRPAVLLADEPTGNLDSKSSAEIMALLRLAAREARCAIFMVTHDHLAAATTDRVLELRDGRLMPEPGARPVFTTGAGAEALMVAT
ncbi:MAG: ABC transporter ATP-binding protein [Polyangiales bacterium]